MRLIHTSALELEEFFGDQIPKYAILSHTWRDGEVTFQDWANEDLRQIKAGYQKIQAACDVARSQSLNYLWVDTNCINKESSAELSEAINSMFAWYQRSSICYAFIDEFNKAEDSLAELGKCRWFKRGWTLQELLAPRNLQFFDSTWQPFGTKQTLLVQLSKITSIHIQCLVHPDSIRLATVARRMSWIADRTTTREEDMAYCLLGIFEINMPLLYGEGPKAFIRLQEEIILHNNDQTILCWSLPISPFTDNMINWNGCLAPHPRAFRSSGDYKPIQSSDSEAPSDFQLTNSGLRISLPLLYGVLSDFKIAILSVQNPLNKGSRVCLCLQGTRQGAYARSAFQTRLLMLPEWWARRTTSIYLAHERDPSKRFSAIDVVGVSAFSETPEYAILPVSSKKGETVLGTQVFHKDLSWVQESFGPLRALFKTDDNNKRSTVMLMRSNVGTIMKVLFVIKLAEDEEGKEGEMEQKGEDEESEDTKWYAKVYLSDFDATGSENEKSTMEIILTGHSEFTIEDEDGKKIIVRPVFIPCENLVFSA